MLQNFSGLKLRFQGQETPQRWTSRRLVIQSNSANYAETTYAFSFFVTVSSWCLRYAQHELKYAIPNFSIGSLDTFVDLEQVRSGGQGWSEQMSNRSPCSLQWHRVESKHI
jgi:hypothetical protein